MKTREDGDICPVLGGGFLLEQRRLNRYNEDVIGVFFGG